MQTQGQRALQQAVSQHEREWQAHPVPVAKMVRTYLQIIESVCAQLLAASSPDGEA